MKSVDWEKLVRVCKDEGFHFEQQADNLYIMTKDGLARTCNNTHKKGSKRIHRLFSWKNTWINYRGNKQTSQFLEKNLNHKLTFVWQFLRQFLVTESLSKHALD